MFNEIKVKPMVVALQRAGIMHAPFLPGFSKGPEVVRAWGYPVENGSMILVSYVIEKNMFIPAHRGAVIKH